MPGPAGSGWAAAFSERRFLPLGRFQLAREEDGERESVLAGRQGEGEGLVGSWGAG